jgi:hypothetical protein
MSLGKEALIMNKTCQLLNLREETILYVAWNLILFR